MRMRNNAALLAVVAWIVVSTPLRAHHGFAAEFDIKKPVKLTGTITKLDWRNPHVWLYIDVKDEAGTVTNWGFEMRSPNDMMRNGWTSVSVKPGETVTAEGYLAKDGTNRVSGRSLASSTGQRLLEGSAPDAQ